MKKIFNLILLMGLFSSCSTHPTNKTKTTNPKTIEIQILETDRNDIPSLAKLYFKLGKSRKASSEINLAIEAFNQSIKKYQQLYSNTNNIYIANCYDELGKIYDFKQEYTKSLKYFQDSYKIKEKFYSSINKKIVMSYKYIGEIYIKLNNIDKALSWLKKAELYSSYLDYDHPSPLTLNLRAKISSLYSNHKRTFGKKIRLRDYILKYGKESIEVASLYRDMAREYEKKGKLELAFDSYRDSTKIYKKIRLPFKKELYTTLFELSNVSKKVSENEIYLDSSIEAFRGYFENRQRIFSTFDMEEQMKFSKKRKKYLYNLFDALSLSDYKDNINKNFNLWINYKRGIFNFENSLYFLSQKDINIKSKYNKWNEKRKKIAQLEQEMSDNSSEKIKNEISLLEREMSYIFSKYNKKIDYTNISNLLNPTQLYIDFAKVEDNYYYFTLDKQENIQFNKIDRIQTKEIDEYIKLIREDVACFGYSSLEDTKRRYAQLYNLIFKNINLKDKTSLIISPDGKLGLIPFEAFYNEKEQKYLIETLKIKYIPSGQELVKLHRDGSQPKSSDIVVFADVNFDNNNSKPQTNKGSIFDSLSPNNGYLKYSKQDAEVVKKLFPNRAKLFLGEDATEDNLLKVNAPKILYLSTHGIFLDDKSILNPMLKSIILLDGANESIRQKKGNGIVSGLELAGLNLHGTELVVLSACETGVGEVEEAEGVAGLSKAFMKAGAKNVIMTLWSVNDKKSALLMEKFYEGLKNKLGYGDALREAKLWMIKDKNLDHPFYWSGFVESGK